MHDVGTAHHSNAFSVSPQAGRLRAEIRVIWIDGPNDFPGKIHNDFEGSAAGFADHAALPVRAFARGFGTLVDHEVSLLDTGCCWQFGAPEFHVKDPGFGFEGIHLEHVRFSQPRLNSVLSIDPECGRYAIVPHLFQQRMRPLSLSC